ncbi:MAG: hypothetical protein ACI4JX_05780, partial [Oscillospiraceae bacterium]
MKLKRILSTILSLAMSASLMLTTIAVQSAAYTGEVESNDTYDAANPLTLGSSVKGMISNDYDSDFFELKIDKSGYIEIEFNHKVLTNENAKWAITVYKFDNKLEEVYSGIMSGAITGTKTPKIGVSSGIYYIKIANGYAYNCYVNDVEYEMTPYFTANDYWECESNNEYSTANPIEINRAYGGFIQNSYDSDFYELKFDKNGYIEIEFNHKVLTNENAKWAITVYKLNDKLEEVYSGIMSGAITGTK